MQIGERDVPRVAVAGASALLARRSVRFFKGLRFDRASRAERRPTGGYICRQVDLFSLCCDEGA